MMRQGRSGYRHFRRITVLIPDPWTCVLVLSIVLLAALLVLPAGGISREGNSSSPPAATRLHLERT